VRIRSGDGEHAIVGQARRHDYRGDIVVMP